MYRTDDPHDDFDRWEREQELRTAKLPECDICGKHIEDHYFNLYGEKCCEDCLDEHFRVTVEI